MLNDICKDPKTGLHPLFVTKEDGTIEIPPSWIGYYSSMNFNAQKTTMGINITVWLDDKGEVPLSLTCTTQEGMMETIAMFDICLGLIRDKKAVESKGVKPSALTLALSHMLTLMENRLETAHHSLRHPNIKIRRHSTKAYSIYHRACQALHGLISTTANSTIHAALRVQKDSVTAH